MAKPLSPKILLIIPAFNEEKNIAQVCRGIIDYNQSHHTSYDFIVINDCSDDLTGQVLKDNHYPHIDLLYNLGIGGAMQTGYKYAKNHNYDIAIQFDGDGQHNLASIAALIEPLIKNRADLVIGSRFISKNQTFRSSFARRIGIKIISVVMHFVAHQRICDSTSGFRAANRKVIHDFAADYPHEYPEPITTAICLRKGYRVKEVPAKMNARISGCSSIHSWKNFYYMFNVCISLLLLKTRRYQ